VNLKNWTLRWFKASVPYLDELRRLFRPKDRFVRRARRILDEISAERFSSEFMSAERIISIHHVKEYGNGHLVIGKYFEKAMRYFGKKFSKVAFVVVSDMGWCRKHFSHLNDVDFVGTDGGDDAQRSESLAVDFTILSRCQHSILTYGTFGIWTALLAGGEMIMADVFLDIATKEVRAVKMRRMQFLVVLNLRKIIRHLLISILEIPLKTKLCLMFTFRQIYWSTSGRAGTAP